MNSEVPIIPDDYFIENCKHWEQYRCLKSGIFQRISKIKSQFEFRNILNNDSIQSDDSQLSEGKIRKSFEEIGFNFSNLFLK